MDVTRETVRLATAAAVCVTSVRAVREMTRHVRLLTDTGRTAARWRRFSALDLVRLGVLARLQEFGIGLPAAVEILDAGVDQHLLCYALCGVEVPADVVLHRLAGRVLHLVPSTEGIHVFAALEFMSPSEGSATLVLNLHLIALDVVRRIEALNNACQTTACALPGGRGRHRVRAPLSTAAEAAITGTDA